MVDRIVPSPGQESVWDYPRPPSLQRIDRLVQIRLGGELIAESRRAWRVCETSHPPAFYLPGEDFGPGALTRASGSSFCEWKGVATYWDLHGGSVVRPAAGWSYEDPTPRFAVMAGAVSVYPGRMDECTVDGETVTPQAGNFYGGWITAAIVGPFKGEPGTLGW